MCDVVTKSGNQCKGDVYYNWLMPDGGERQLCGFHYSMMKEGKALEFVGGESSVSQELTVSTEADPEGGADAYTVGADTVDSVKELTEREKKEARREYLRKAKQKSRQRARMSSAVRFDQKDQITVTISHGAKVGLMQMAKDAGISASAFVEKLIDERWLQLTISTSPRSQHSNFRRD